MIIQNYGYRIIVGMTTWPKRIDHIEPSIRSILLQKQKPYIFYLVLSEQEFPNKVLPKFINDYLKEYPNFKLLWVKENLYQFKKNIPILKLYKNRSDIVYFSADDDVCYHENYIKTLYEKFIALNINGDTLLTWHFPWEEFILKTTNYKNNEHIRLIGWCEIFKPSFFNNIVTSITENDIKVNYFNKNAWISEDLWISYNLQQAGITFVQDDYSELEQLVEKTENENNNPLSKIYLGIPDSIMFNNVKELYNRKKLIYGV